MAKCIHAQSGHLPLASIDAFSSLKQFEQYPPLSLIVALLALCMIKYRVSNHFEGLLMLQSRFYFNLLGIFDQNEFICTGCAIVIDTGE